MCVFVLQRLTNYLLYFNLTGSEVMNRKPSPQVDPSNTKLQPIKRPDKGGVVSVRSVNLYVNHFRVKFDQEKVIWHYDVEIKGDNPTKKISRFELAKVKDKVFTDQFPLAAMTAYDGRKNIFSSAKLPTGPYNVVFSEAEELRGRSYTFTIKEVKELKLGELQEYMTGKGSSVVPREVLQGLDVVMKEHPSKHLTTVGKSIFTRDETVPYQGRNSGVEAKKGYRQSLKPTKQGLSLCLDYSVMAFRKLMPIIDYLKLFLGVSDLLQDRIRWRDVEKELTGLKVTVNHRKNKQKLTIVGLSKEDTINVTFNIIDQEGKEPHRETSIVDYFMEKYEKEIRHVNIPCLDLGKYGLVPMEFCDLVEGPIYPKGGLHKDQASWASWLKRLSIISPQQRRNNINTMIIYRDGPSGYVCKDLIFRIKQLTLGYSLCV